MPHDYNPPQTLQEQVAQGLKIGNRLDRVRNEPDLVSVFGDKSSDQQVVGRQVLDSFVSAELY